MVQGRTLILLQCFFIIFQVTIFFHYLYVAPVMIVIVTILCWQEIGVYVLPGVVIFLLLGPLQGLIGRFFAKLRYFDQGPVSQRRWKRFGCAKSFLVNWYYFRDKEVYTPETSLMKGTSVPIENNYVRKTVLKS